MFEDKSIKRALEKQNNFRPPYCPNNLCAYHHHPTAHWFQKYGWNSLKNFPYKMRRGRCLRCRKTFTYSFFKLEFGEQHRTLNPTIFRLYTTGLSKCEIARIVRHSEHLVRCRLSKMARWALLQHAQWTQNLSLSEPIVYDGLENFSHSQYDPNNINHAIGKNSYFTYDFNFAPMNRKGKMNMDQKLRKKELEVQFGKYPSNILRTTSKRVFQRLFEKSDKAWLSLYTDEHFQYKKALQFDLRNEEILQETTSSKAARNFQNPLFAVNNFDLLIRQKSAAFKRETIAFSKHSISMVEKFVLAMIQKNYMRPIFYKKHVRDPKVHSDSPAMRVGVCRKILSFHEFFKVRHTASQVPLNEDWFQFYLKKDPLSRRKIVPNLMI